MIRKLLQICLLFICFTLISPNIGSANADMVAKMEQNKKLCETLKKQPQQHSGSAKSLGGGFIPDSVLKNIYNTTKKLHQAVSLVHVLGDSLMCHAVHTDPKPLRVWKIELLKLPNFPVWIAGLITYFFGFMFMISITFYIIDISFKLGFAILLLPIGIALWPFSITTDKLTKLISIILKSAAIFAFLAITVSYAINMLTASIGALEFVFDDITNSNTDAVKENFSIFSMSYIIILFSLIYGFKLIGSTIPDYVDKFFPDNVFGGQDSSPMHHMATQAMDFAKKKIAQPAFDVAKDFAAVKAGRATVKAGKLLKGDYHDQIKRAIHNPSEAIGIVAGKSLDKGLNIISGTGKAINHLKYGAKIAQANLMSDKAGKQALKQNLRLDRAAADRKIDNAVHSPLREGIQNLQKSIDKNEEALQRQKAQQHANRLQNDPKYQDKVRKDKLKAIKKANRQAEVAGFQTQIQNIEKNRKQQLDKINTDKFNNGVDTVSKAVKAILPTRLTDSISKIPEAGTNGINKAQKGINEGIDKLVPDNANDGDLKWGSKLALRGALKIVPNTLAVGLKTVTTLTDKTLKAPGKIANGAVDVLSAATKATASGIVNLPNNLKTNLKAGLQKTVLRAKKGYYGAPDTINAIGKATLKTPGSMLERIGKEMQHRKKRRNYGPSEDELEEEERKQQEQDAFMNRREPPKEESRNDD